mmetsp:Transcript_84328/g.123343  ORF Transcript_84328/g.123343 Transcript_84328/m.123343 type:complete len:259 (+) Transcript_84328:670-1446(+)
MSTRLLFLAAVGLLFVICCGSKSDAAAPFVVLTEFSPRIAIRNITLNVPLRTTHIACQGEAIIFFLSLPRFSSASAPDITKEGEHGQLTGNEALEVVFSVSDLIMGPGAGRAVVMVDEQTVAECPSQYCQVSLSTNLLTTAISSTASHSANTTAPSTEGYPELDFPLTLHHVQMILMAPEADMPTQAVVLGIQRSFAVALVQLADDDTARFHLQAVLGSLTRSKHVLSSESISLQYCTDHSVEVEKEEEVVVVVLTAR